MLEFLSHWLDVFTRPIHTVAAVDANEKPRYKCAGVPVQMKTEESPGLLMGLVVHGRSGDVFILFYLFYAEAAVGEMYTHQEQSTVLVYFACWGQ